MKLIGNLREKASKAKTKEELNNVLLDAGMELTGEELENVDGGFGYNGPSRTMTYQCPKHPDNSLKVVEVNGIRKKVCTECGREAIQVLAGSSSFV